MVLLKNYTSRGGRLFRGKGGELNRGMAFAVSREFVPFSIQLFQLMLSKSLCNKTGEVIWVIYS